MPSVKSRKHQLNHDLNHHRTWLPLVLVGCAFLVIAGVKVVREVDVFGLHEGRDEDESAQAAAVADRYREDLTAAITAFKENHDREAFLRDLLTMTVPPDYLDAHIKMVIAADATDYSEKALLDLINM